MAYEAALHTEPQAGGSERAPAADLSTSPSVIATGMLDRLLCFQVRKAQLVLQRRGLRQMTTGQIGMAEFGTMVLCEQNPGMAQFQVAEALDIDKACVVAVVHRLEELGWLLRRRCTHDRRRHGLFLTADGLREVHQLRTQAEAAESFARDMYSPAELEQLSVLLARLG
jgi:DNA-binding MarR family transcriptional regulator